LNTSNEYNNIGNISDGKALRGGPCRPRLRGSRASNWRCLVVCSTKIPRQLMRVYAELYLSVMGALSVMGVYTLTTIFSVEGVTIKKRVE
jgi:hypothetical protein